MLKQLFGLIRRLFGGKVKPLALPPGSPDRDGDSTAGAVAKAATLRVTDRRSSANPDPAAKPIKPGAQRLAFRNPVLVPKEKKHRAWNAPKPPKLMTQADGKRLFGDTLRTRNQNLRSIATDVAQLDRYGLPHWETEADVAKALDISVRELRHYSIHRMRERVPHYITYAIPKRSGGQRLIHAPKARLKAILRKLQTELVGDLPVSEHAHGFRVGRSVKTGAEQHVGKRVVMKLDLREFFPTVTSARVRGYLIALGYGYPVAATLAVLATESVRQPVDIGGTIFHVPVGPRTCVQGAPTSPGLCNAIVYKLDRRIAALATRAGFAYTRYADDLTLSGDDVDAAHRLRKQIERVVREEGFEINTEKTRVMTRGGAQRVTGVTVNQVLGLSRKQRRLIRAMIHRNDPAQRRQVEGMIAWVEMLNPTQAKALRDRLK